MRKRLATVVVAAGFAALSASMVLAQRTPAPTVDEDLRATAASLMGAVSATPEAEISTPQAELGRALFWDMRLSANGQVACASCHFRENWGSDSRPLSTDARNRPTSRQSQTVFHSQDTPGLRWLGDRATGADQAVGSITGSMGFAARNDIIPVLRRHGYEERFRAAFPGQADPVTPANYGAALQVYQTTLRTPAPFDRWLGGEDRAMTEQQQRGLRRFIEVGCVGCHNGPLLGGQMLQRFGVTGNYWEHTGSVQIDSGLMTATRNEDDRFFFRVPLLRNIARTEPYFHDGSVASLRRATEIMGRVQLGQALDAETLDDLVAFQEALTGEIPANFSPPPGIPFELPQGVTAR